MKYGFNVYKTNVDGHQFWIAESKDLKGCIGQGETLDEAVAELDANEAEWLDAAEDHGIPIPEPTVEPGGFSGKFVTRVSPQTHREASISAKRQGISLNQYINNAIVTMNATNETMHFIKQAISDGMFEFSASDDAQRKTKFYRQLG